jgi:hypothetical protein
MYLVKKINAECSFNYGPRVDVLDEFHYSYLVEFYENLGDDWSLVHSWFDLKAFHYYVYRRYFRTRWKIKVWAWENDEPVLVVEHLYCEENKNIGFEFEHNSYKVQKKWTEKALKFKDRNRCQIIISSKFYKKLSEDFCDEKVIFVENLDRDSLYATYEIKRHDIQSNTENWWESDLIYEAHSKAYKSWYIPVDWVTLSSEDIFDAIIGDE